MLRSIHPTDGSQVWAWSSASTNAFFFTAAVEAPAAALASHPPEH